MNAAVMLIFLVGIQHRMSATKFRVPLWIGLGLYAVAALVLILSAVLSLWVKKTGSRIFAAL